MTQPPPESDGWEWLRLIGPFLVAGFAGVFGYIAKALQTIEPRVPLRYHLGGVILAFTIANIMHDLLDPIVPGAWQGLLYGLLGVSGWASDRLVRIFALGMEKRAEMLFQQKEDKKAEDTPRGGKP